MTTFPLGGAARAPSTPPARGQLRALVAVAALMTVAGCASFTPDGGFSPVRDTVRQRVGQDVAWQRSEQDRAQARDRVTQLLSRPLSADDAVQVALLNNQGLQAAFYQLGVAEADLVSAGRVPNPGVSFARLRRGDEVEFERSFHLGLVQLLTLPLARQAEQRRFEQTRWDVAQNTVALAHEVRAAYFTAVAADQTAAYRRQVQDAAEAGTELAKRMAQAGNWSKLQQAREQAFHADAVLGLAHAEEARLVARERLARLLGLESPPEQVPLPDRLPDLPQGLDDLATLEQTAMERRLDVRAARLRTENLARNLGLTRATRLVNVLELGVLNNSSNVEPTQRGYEISLELPLFDWGTARTAKAEALYMQSMHSTAQTALEARSQVRQAYQSLRTRYGVARHYRDEVVPLKKRISDEVQLRYNGMMASVFDLLADARSQVDSVNASIEAQRDFWMARADFDMALTGPVTPGPAASTGAAPAATPAAAH